VLDAVREGSADRAMVPIENSVEGGVSATLDALSSGVPLVVRGEAVVQVEFVLAARSGTTLEQVERIATHPHAWAQCRRWLSHHAPQATHVPATSTTSAAALLSASQQQDFEAAITAPWTAQQYDLQMLAEGIGDN